MYRDRSLRTVCVCAGQGRTDIPIAANVNLGHDVLIHHPALVNLYGCRIDDETKTAMGNAYPANSSSISRTIGSCPRPTRHLAPRHRGSIPVKGCDECPIVRNATAIPPAWPRSGGSYERGPRSSATWRHRIRATSGSQRAFQTGLWGLWSKFQRTCSLRRRHTHLPPVNPLTDWEHPEPQAVQAHPTCFWLFLPDRHRCSGRDCRGEPRERYDF